MSKKVLAIALVFVLTYIAVSYKVIDKAYAQTAGTTVTVTDVQGNPVSGADVYFKDNILYTVGTGKATIGSINETDVYNILVFAEEFNSASDTIVYNDVVESNNVTIQLNAGEASAIRSLVTNESGSPVSEASLITLNGGNSLTDTYGYGHITGVHEGKYTVIASKSGYNSFYSLVTVTQSAVATQPITLTGNGETATQFLIKGRVTSDLDENGVEGVTISDGITSVVSDRYGYYAIGSYSKDDEVTITVNDDSYQGYSRTVTIGSADVTENIALNAYLPITVTVKDSKTGNPIKDATAFLNKTEDKTDITGKATVGTVWAGAIFNLVAYADGYNPKTAVVTFDIAKPAGEITIELDEGKLGAIISTVTNAETTKAIPESSLETLNGGRSTADTSGLCIITGLPEGEYTTIASKTGFNQKYELIDVAENNVITLPFALTAISEENESTIITGRVTSARTGNDMDGVTITDGTNTAVTDLNGYYAIGYYGTDADVSLTAKFTGFYDTEKPVSITTAETTANFALDRDTKVEVDPYIFGYTDATFRPNNKVTRAEAAQIIYSLYGNNSKPTNELQFTDVPSTAYFTDALKFVVASDYMTGYGDGTFKPYNQLNRQELAVVIDRIKRYNDTSDIPFTDVEAGHWSEASIRRLYANNVIAGYTDNTFRPKVSASRAEMVTFIARAEGRHQTWLGDKTFTDVATSHFGYNYIMNAANGYTRW